MAGRHTTGQNAQIGLCETHGAATGCIETFATSINSADTPPTTIQRKLAALSSLFAYLCEQNAALHNPVDGVKRPKSNRQEGTTPALTDEQARALLNAPQGDSLKARRDRAILATLAYHGMRREELCKLKVRDLQRRDGVLLQFRIEG